MFTKTTSKKTNIDKTSSESFKWNEHCETLKKLVEKIIKPEKIRLQSKVFKALADETRLKILTLLQMKPLCVCELMAALNLTQPTASHHIQILEAANLIREEKHGKWRFFHIVHPDLVSGLLKLEFK